MPYAMPKSVSSFVSVCHHSRERFCFGKMNGLRPSIRTMRPSGFKDVNVTLILSLIAYWVIGLPLGYALAEQFGFGPDGYWIGLIAGLAAGAVLLVMRLIHIVKRYEAQPITNETS